MDQSTEKLLLSSNNSDSPLFGISNDSSPSIAYDLATNSPEQSIIADTLPAFKLGAYHRTRHLSCILENWSESESYNSLPMEVTQQSDDSFNTMLDRKPMCWEAEDVSEYITTLDESCILDIESIEQIDKISDQQESVNPWSNNTWPHRVSGETSRKKITVDVHATDTNDVYASPSAVKSGIPVLEYPKIMTTSCYGALSNPFVDKSFEDVNTIHKSADELTDKNHLDEFLYLNPMINNQAKCRSPLPTSLSNSFIDGTTSMNASFTEPKSMQSSIDFSGVATKTTTINPLEISVNLSDGSKYFSEEAVGKFEEVVDNGGRNDHEFQPNRNVTGQFNSYDPAVFGPRNNQQTDGYECERMGFGVPSNRIGNRQRPINPENDEDTTQSSRGNDNEKQDADTKIEHHKLKRKITDMYKLKAPLSFSKNEANFNKNNWVKVWYIGTEGFKLYQGQINCPVCFKKVTPQNRAGAGNLPRWELTPVKGHIERLHREGKTVQKGKEFGNEKNLGNVEEDNLSDKETAGEEDLNGDGYASPIASPTLHLISSPETKSSLAESDSSSSESKKSSTESESSDSESTEPERRAEYD